MRTKQWLAGVVMLFLAASASALDIKNTDVAAFIDTLVNEDGLDRGMVEHALTRARMRDDIIESISKPAERRLEWHDYRNIFIKPKRVVAGVEFWNEHAATIDAVSQSTGVPPEILVGIIGVETYYGRITGKHRVLDSLATLGFGYPPRSDFFRRELRTFFKLVAEEDIDLDTALGSYAGAMGRPQFIASSYLEYAVDTDGDGKRDLFDSWPDVIGSVANYFVRHRWQQGEPVVVPATLSAQHAIDIPKKNARKTNTTVGTLRSGGASIDSQLSNDEAARLIAFVGEDGPEYYVGLKNFYVITEYNHSAMYAMAVWQLGQAVAAERRTLISQR
ncbi:MAG: lytic murein transglycosylase B [Pseudomonadota bacterium]